MGRTAQWARGRRTLIGALEGEGGAAMGEYAVVLGVISIGTVAVFGALAGGVAQAIGRVVGVLP